LTTTPKRNTYFKPVGEKVWMRTFEPVHDQLISGTGAAVKKRNKSTGGKNREKKKSKRFRSNGECSISPGKNRPAKGHPVIFEP
jgi:hypothetical protein